MNVELMKQWIAALRSGKYKQDVAVLRSELGFCCLGVLCDVVAPDEWEEGSEGYYLFRGFEIDLPDSIADQVMLTNTGLKRLYEFEHNPDTWYFDDAPYTTLAGANDSRISFGEIADALEQYMNEYLEGVK